MHIRYQVIHTSTKATILFSKLFISFLRMKEVESEITFIYHYGLDHGLQLKSYLKLIMKSKYWLLQVEKLEIKIQKVLFCYCFPTI
jgi:hypothetical protein